TSRVGWARAAGAVSPSRATPTTSHADADISLGGRPAASSAQQPVPNRDSQQNGEHAEYEKRRNPALRLLRFAADTDHHPRNLIGAVRFCAPEAVAIRLEYEFAFGIGMPGDCGSFRVAWGEYP